MAHTVLVAKNIGSKWEVGNKYLLQPLRSYYVAIPTLQLSVLWSFHSLLYVFILPDSNTLIRRMTNHTNRSKSFCVFQEICELRLGFVCWCGTGLPFENAVSISIQYWFFAQLSYYNTEYQIIFISIRLPLIYVPNVFLFYRQCWGVAVESHQQERRRRRKFRTDIDWSPLDVKSMSSTMHQLLNFGSIL